MLYTTFPLPPPLPPPPHPTPNVLHGFCVVHHVFALGENDQMEGDISSEDHMGVIPRSVHAIFSYLEGIQADYTVRTSFLELYNEARSAAWTVSLISWYFVRNWYMRYVVVYHDPMLFSLGSSG